MQNVAENQPPEVTPQDPQDRAPAPTLCPCTDGGRNQPAEDCNCDNGMVR